jgi:predicted ArsR family transcriptional regulator
MIIATLKEMPRNASQLADELGLDYKTTWHHLGVLT